MGNKISLEDELINLRVTSKQMKRSSLKCINNEKKEIDKLKIAIEHGHSECAKIHGENAIREKNQSLNYMKLSSCIDSVSSRVETDIRMNQITKSIKGVSNGMTKGLLAMNFHQLSGMLDKFESQFEDLDVKSSYMESTINSTVSMTTPLD